MSISQEELDSVLDAGFAERALEAFLDSTTGDFVIEEAVEALEIMDMVNPERPLSEDLSPKGIEFLRGLRQEALMCMESLRPGARASLELILKDIS